EVPQEVGSYDQESPDGTRKMRKPIRSPSRSPASVRTTTTRRRVPEHAAARDKLRPRLNTLARRARSVGQRAEMLRAQSPGNPPPPPGMGDNGCARRSA